MPASKIVPPHWHDGLLHRERLTNLIERGLRVARACMICAPPGYGKSTLLADLAQRTVGTQVWIRLDAEDKDPTRLASCLTAAVDHALAPDPSRSLSPPQVNDSVDPRTQVLTAAARLTVPVRESIVFVDDLDAIYANDRALDLLFRFLRALPEHVLVMIASRLPLPQSLADLYSANRMIRIGPQDLQFTTEEMEAYMTAVDIQVDEWPRILRELAACEGWPGAIPLLSWPSPSAPAQRRTREADAVQAFGRLAQTVLDSLSPTELAVLRQIANLERINVDLCRDCLGIDRAETILASLAENNVFLQACDRPGDYRFHSLFRKYFSNQASWLSALDSRQHRLVAEWLLLHGDTVSAVGHLIAAKQIATATTLVSDACRALANSGQFREVLDLLERSQRAAGGDLPPQLARWRAHALHFLGDSTGAVRVAREALDDPRADASCQAQLLAVVSFANIRRGCPDEGVAEAHRVIALGVEVEPASIIDSLRALFFSLYTQFHLQSGLSKLKDALSIARSTSRTGDEALILSELSAVLQIQGNLSLAIESAQRSLLLAEQVSSSFAASLACNNLGTAWHSLGYYVNAREMLSRGKSIACRFHHLAIEAGLWLSEGDLLLDLMRPDSARLCYLRAAALARDVELPQETAYAHRALSHLYRQGGDLTASRAALELAGQWLQPWQRFDWLQHHYAWAWLAIAEGRVEEGVDRLRETVEGFQRGGARLWEARSRLALAYGLYTSTGVDDALPELDALLALVKDIGENQFLIPDAARMPRLWAAVVHAGRRDLCSALSEPDLRPRPSAQSRGLPNTARYSDPAPALLEPREREIVIGLCEGLTREEVGSRLGLSLSTINKSISDIYAATGFTKTHQLVAWAHRCGLYSPAEAPPPQIHDAPSAYRAR